MAEETSLGDRSLYLCTPDRPDLERFIAACIRGGVDIVQLREKELDARPLLAGPRRAVGFGGALGLTFILTARPYLALAGGADGVHVGQDDAPPSLCRKLLGPDAIIGYSTHATTELDAALAEPADYVAIGPVLPTATHPTRTPTGLDYVRYAAATADRPWFVTGNARPDTIGPMLEAGARRFVAVRWLTESSDPEGAARALRAEIDRYAVI